MPLYWFPFTHATTHIDTHLFTLWVFPLTKDHLTLTADKHVKSFDGLRSATSSGFASPTGHGSLVLSNSCQLEQGHHDNLGGWGPCHSTSFNIPENPSVIHSLYALDTQLEIWTQGLGDLFLLK